MLIKLALATVALLSTAASTQDKVDFSHTYAKDAKVTFELVIKGDVDGAPVSSTVPMTSLVKEVKDGGGARVDVSAKHAVLEYDGNAMEPVDMAATFELMPTGIPTSMTMEGFESIMVLNLLCQVLPNKQLAAGETFTVDTPAGAPFTHNGKFVGLEVVDGVSLAKLEQMLEVRDRVTMSLTTYLNPATKAIVKVESKMSIDVGDFTVTLTAKG